MNNPHYFDTGSLVAIGNQYKDVTGRRHASGSTYAFFDPHDFYGYTLDETEDLTALLAACAGPRPTLGQ